MESTLIAITITLVIAISIAGLNVALSCNAIARAIREKK